MLLTTAQKLQVVLAGAITTNQLQVQTSYVDFPSANPGGFGVLTNSTTDVDIVAAPSVGLRRVVELTVYNADTVNATVSIKVDEGGTDKIKVKVLLNPGQTLAYGSAGWQVVAATQRGAAYASFHATKNGTDQTAIASATATKITFTTEAFDVGAYYDSANSKWTPPAGKALIHASIYWSGGVADGQEFQIYLYKNGTLVNIGPQNSAAATTDRTEITLLDDCNGTDYYEIYGYGPAAGNKTVSGNIYWTYFEGLAV